MLISYFRVDFSHTSYMSYPEITDSTQKMAVSFPLLNLGTSTDITQLVHEERDAFLTYLYNFCIFEQKS